MRGRIVGAAVGMSVVLAGMSGAYGLSGYVSVGTGGPGAGGILQSRLILLPSGQFLVTKSGSLGTQFRVGLGDFNGDSIPDLVTATGFGGADVWNGTTGTLILHVAGVASFYSGIAVGDVNGDGTPDVFGPAMVNASNVEGVFDGKTGVMIRSYPLINNEVASADFNHDGRADIVEGGSVFDGQTGASLMTFPYISGASVAVGDVNGDGQPDFAEATKTAISIYSGVDQQLMKSFNLGSPADGFFPIGVALADLTGDGRADIVWGVGGIATIVDGQTLNALGLFNSLSGVLPLNFVAAYGTPTATPEAETLGILGVAIVGMVRRRQG